MMPSGGLHDIGCRLIPPTARKVDSAKFNFVITEFSEVISRILHRSPSQGREERF
jgi:hypothetical protein